MNFPPGSMTMSFQWWDVHLYINGYQCFLTLVYHYDIFADKCVSVDDDDSVRDSVLYKCTHIYI